MVYGFLNINKQKWKTSFDVIRDLRYITNISKMGHTGTLDPLAEGVLVIALNEATKLIEFLMDSDKEYKAEIVLGSSSDTYDAQGNITKVSSQKPSEDEIIKVLKGFIGEIDQIPPKFSSIKVKGKRAYELARKGKDFELESRKVHIKKIDLISYKYPNLNIDVTCSSGTYIRSLANDIGEKLGSGAYLNELLRIRVGKFLLEDSYKVEEISDKGLEKCIINVEEVFSDFEKIQITNEELKKLNFGQAILKPEINKDIKYFTAFFDKKLVGMLEKVQDKTKGLLKYKRKLNIE